MPIGKTLGETDCSAVWKERDSLGYGSNLICGQGPIGCPGNQVLGNTIEKLKVRKDMYMDLFERLLPLSGVFYL